MRDRPLCAELSLERDEPLGATASHIDHWVLIEYRGLWSRDPAGGSALTDAVKAHLREQLAARPRSRLLFIRRPDRRREAGLVCFFGSTPERGGRFDRVDLEAHQDLLELDFRKPADAVEHPLLIVCTHGKRDRCCARYGRPLYDALRDLVEPAWLWQATHVGGDRFAGNLVCFPHGLYFGRVGPGEAAPLLEEYLAERVALERYRGRCCYPFPVQAAEEAVRSAARLTGIDDVRLRSVQEAEGGWRVVLGGGAASYEVEVKTELGELTYLTCSANELKRPVRYAARILR